MKHTQGKWEVIECGNDFIIQPFKGSKSIAEVHNHRDKGDAEAEANARLIAAAPDLLAACRHGAMSSHHPSCSHGKRGDGNTCECHVKKCQDAVKKATT